MSAARDALRAAHEARSDAESDLARAQDAHERGQALVARLEAELAAFEEVEARISDEAGSRIADSIRSGGVAVLDDGPVTDAARSDRDGARARIRRRIASARSAARVLNGDVIRATAAVAAAASHIPEAAAEVIREHGVSIARKLRRVESDATKLRAELHGLADVRVPGARNVVVGTAFSLPAEADEVLNDPEHDAIFRDAQRNGAVFRALNGTLDQDMVARSYGQVTPNMYRGGARQRAQSFFDRLLRDPEASQHDLE